MNRKPVHDIRGVTEYLRRWGAGKCGYALVAAGKGFLAGPDLNYLQTYHFLDHDLSSGIFKHHVGDQLNRTSRILFMDGSICILHVNRDCCAFGFFKMHEPVSADAQPFQFMDILGGFKRSLNAAVKIWAYLGITDVSVYDRAG